MARFFHPDRNRDDDPQRAIRDAVAHSRQVLRSTPPDTFPGRRTQAIRREGCRCSAGETDGLEGTDATGVMLPRSVLGFPGYRETLLRPWNTVIESRFAAIRNGRMIRASHRNEQRASRSASQGGRRYYRRQPEPAAQCPRADCASSRSFDDPGGKGVASCQRASNLRVRSRSGTAALFRSASYPPALIACRSRPCAT